MAHRGQWSEHEARGILSAWRTSGQSLERFAKERGPFAYLADVLPRVQDHPKRRLDELLRGPWSRAHASA